MSIAVSAVVQPSRLLLLMLAAMSVIAIAVGLAIGAGLLGELSAAACFSLSVFSLFLAFFGFYHGIRYRKTIHIDISGTGQLRIDEAVPGEPCTNTKWPHVRAGGEVFRLMRDSTIWPHFLLLRLQADSGKTRTVPILPDSISPEGFRALSVACRWIAAHDHSSARENF